ncbi:DNA base-excision repair protein [Grosmannia clavigera kw1407]|uniref:DNA base-excision repair protein n=1 Tax=Grosmannia clavigera (strain kw1407 / UAMH 11150) TaxID=655863 RepID=F0XM65_GROCL|nr:DNA base-excision repair protein [Grosmannia clavigera kw1407]EFX01134.1 DNA base-excision repair protein [Grosmannia clavigera kw1407]
MTSLRRSSRLKGAVADEGVAANDALATDTASSIPAVPRARKRKSVAMTFAEPEPAASPARPSTPPPPESPRKRRGRPSSTKDNTTNASVTSTATDSPSTPRTKPRHATVSRLADPKATNAPLLSPETSRLIVVSRFDSKSRSLAAGEAIDDSQQITTDNILQVACEHLIAVDPRMKPLIDMHYCAAFSPESLAKKVDPFESLASSIISQQVSGAAAKAIKGRFIALFSDPGGTGGEAEVAVPVRFPHPSQVAVMPLDRLRTAGLSQRKAEYVQGLAEKFASGELSAQLLAEAPYETLVERLVAVRGLGLWSVEMFAMFGLKRMDVFSVGDLGVQRGMAAFAGRNVAKLKSGKGKWKYMKDTEMQTIAEPFRPYRSVFMWYMWRTEMTDVSTLES